jgi:DNA-binding MarR family transcriptional regulator
MQTFQRMHMVNPHASEIAKGDLMMMKRIAMNSEAEDGIMISRLAELMEITNSAVSQKISALEERGYVERYSTKDDRRRVYVRMTLTGNEVLKRENARLIESMAVIFDRMGEEDTDKFIDLLDKLYQIVSEIRNDNKNDNSNNNKKDS